MTSHLTLKEVIYIILVMITIMATFMLGVNLKSLLSINGAVLGYFYVILIPIWVHLKCIYFNRSSGFIENDEEWNSKIVLNECECHQNYSAKWKLYL